jgi:Peptidase propeptide and YPEB domain
MDRRTKWIAGGALALAVVGGGTGVAIATGAGDTDSPLTGSTLDTARAAALRFTGGGTVIETEAGDDGAAYGVEVRLEDGRVVEVRLDARFQVLGHEADDDGSNDQDASNDN